MMNAVTADLNDIRTVTARDKFAAYIELTKPRIAVLLVLTSAAGFYLGSPAGFEWILFAHSMAAITLLAFGVATLNQWLERDLDLLMDRTKRRPLPARTLSPNDALIFGVLQCVIAEVYLFALVNVLTGILGLVVILGYVLVYTPLKTRTT
ncbi:MAG: UbiA family prenyltransferase, partial [Blastocatellia bacterium]|nr:UbiA family prenyltransferase [Blastocatellia bacterium]